MNSMPRSLGFDNSAAFRQWLQTNAACCSELLLVFQKVAKGMPGLSYADSVDEALCVGWIDGVRRRVDAHHYSVRFTPRQARSIWSTVNIASVQRLRAEQPMTPAGEAAFALRTPLRSGTSTASATHQLTRMPPHMMSSIPVPNRITSGTSGMPSFIAGRVAPL
jgi:uncharacterized protein YdeI (YjbR/CyaY-like superfamily)